MTSCGVGTLCRKGGEGGRVPFRATKAQSGSSSSFSEGGVSVGVINDHAGEVEVAVDDVAADEVIPDHFFKGLIVLASSVRIMFIVDSSSMTMLLTSMLLSAKSLMAVSSIAVSKLVRSSTILFLRMILLLRRSLINMSSRVMSLKETCLIVMLLVVVVVVVVVVIVVVVVVVVGVVDVVG